MTVRQAIAAAVRENVKLPAVLQSVIETAHADLWHGPVYFDEAGERCLWSEGVRRFDVGRHPAWASRAYRRPTGGWLGANQALGEGRPLVGR